PCFTAMRAEIALMSGSAFAVTHYAFSSGAGRTSDGNGSHASTLKSPSYTKSVSWQHYRHPFLRNLHCNKSAQYRCRSLWLTPWQVTLSDRCYAPSQDNFPSFLHNGKRHKVLGSLSTLLACQHIHIPYQQKFQP